MPFKGTQPPDEQHQHREEQLREREQALRLRELEMELVQKRDAEIDRSVETLRMEPQRAGVSRWRRKLSVGTKLLAIGVVIAAGIKLSSWIAMGLVIAGTGWLIYKAFFEGESPRE